jgi:hemin uptake protein HemP
MPVSLTPNPPQMGEGSVKKSLRDFHVKEPAMQTVLATPAAARPHEVAVPLPALENTVSSRSLMGSASTLIIEHMGMHYVLRATRNGKLILTK